MGFFESLTSRFPAAPPIYQAARESRIIQTRLNRVLAFTRLTIDDVINNPIAKRQVLGYWKLPARSTAAARSPSSNASGTQRGKAEAEGQGMNQKIRAARDGVRASFRCHRARCRRRPSALVASGC